MLKLKVNPTFRAKVEIPAPGGEKVELEFEFKHMTKSAFHAWQDDRRARIEAGEKFDDVSDILELATAWYGVDGDFNRENVKTLLDLYHAAAEEIGRAYVRELMQARLGN